MFSWYLASIGMRAVLVNRSWEGAGVKQVDGAPVIHALTELSNILDQRLEVR